jgi:hypothetical protein
MSLLASALLVLGCGGGNGDIQFRQEKRQFAIVMKSKLRQFSKRTDALMSRVEDDSLQVEKVKSLRSTRDVIDDKVAGIDAATRAEWKEMKPAMEAAYRDLEHRYAELEEDAVRMASTVLPDSVDQDDLGGAGAAPAAEVTTEPPVRSRKGQ